MRRAFPILASVLVLAVVVQFFLAASGAYDPAPTDEAFQPHRGLGYGVVLYALLLTVLAALARMPGRLTGMTGLVAGLGLVQIVIRASADAVTDTGPAGGTAGKLVFGVHAVNGLTILALAGIVAWRAGALSKSTVDDRPVAAGTSPEAGS